ncbi:zinc finger CCCH-type with G patch domain-containing protein-like, partial [Agrilus planipennis]
MEEQSLRDSLNTYKKQLVQVNLAISTFEDGKDKEDLFSLKNNLEQLIQLTKESFQQLENLTASTSSSSDTSTSFDCEYALFMSEMEKDGVLLESNETSSSKILNIEDELKAIEGMKCKAPHKHQWGDVIYHNALICSVVACENYSSMDDIEVKVMFINPTHEEMLPCPYLLESSCKFDDEKCKYSHGEVVAFSCLKEYIEPKFELLTNGSKVLAKQKN